MSLFVLGINHRTASVAIRERFALRAEEIPAVAQSLRQHEDDEIIVLSTCNRVEFYFTSSDPNALTDAINNKLRSQAKVSAAVLSKHSYQKQGTEALTHLFRVSASLDSMVVGEPQILGQLKSAVQQAREAGTIGGKLDRFTSKAFASAKKVRHQTGIGEQRVSLSSVAAELAKQVFGDLEKRKVLLIGAGKMAELAANQFAQTGADILVANRGRERADELAGRIGGVSRSLDELKQLLIHVDVVIASTAASQYLLLEEDLNLVMKQRKYRPIFFIDIAVPRNIDPKLNRIDGVYLYDLDALSTITQQNMEKRESEVAAAEEIIRVSIAQMNRMQDADLVKPTIIELRNHVLSLVDNEVQQVAAKMNVAPENKPILERLGANIANKILHGAIEELKKSAGSEQQDEVVEKVRRVFKLSSEDKS